MKNEISGEKTLCAVHFLSREPIQLSFARFVHCLSPLLALFNWHTVNLCLDGPQFQAILQLNTSSFLPFGQVSWISWISALPPSDSHNLNFTIQLNDAKITTLL